MATANLPSPRAVLLLLAPIAFAVAIVACGSSASDSTDPGEATEAATSTSSADAEDVAEDSDGTEDADQTTTSATETTEAAAEESEVVPVLYDGSFANSIQPIFADRCASCHSPGGPGTTHWVLETVDDISVRHELLSLIIQSGRMPPWPAGGDSPAFHEDRSLSAGQVQAVLDWSADGAPLDVSTDTPIEPTTEVIGLDNPDLLLTPANPYAGSTEVTDDYRCQVYDPQLPEGGWITDYEFIPDQTEVVHHAIGYMVPAAARARAEAQDGQDGKPGWQCYGSSGLGEDELFIGWAPGQLPSEMPEGTGLWLEPGAFIVVQIHYHYETEAPADLSALAINVAGEDEIAAAGGRLDDIVVTEYIAPAEIPCADGETGPLCDRDAAYAAAIERYGEEGVRADVFLRLCGASVEDFAGMTDGRASASCHLPAGLMGGTGEIISVLGHEHEIGDWFKMTLNPGRPDEQVLLDIPDWDFDWQYNYRPVDKIVIDADDVVLIECGWDRNRRDPDLEPAYILWADGTNDEMCFATISTRPVS